ncbi:MAG: methionine synthase [Dehalococcoidia bacterium]
MKGLLTTSVGSFPKPPYLQQARGRFARGEIERGELRELEKQATKEWIEAQEEIGIDILVDGEQDRGDMVTYFAENLEGFAISGLVRSYGNRYYRKPVAVGPIHRTAPITIDMFRYAQSLTDKPVKGMLTGPYTICDWSFNEHFDSREDFVLELAQVVHQEALDLQAAGARFIQIDEPAISTRSEELDLAIEAMKVATEGLTATTITHICYGDFTKIYPRMLDIPVDIFDLEMTNSGFDLLDILARHPFNKKLSVGVVDVHSHVIESPQQVAQGLRRVLGQFPPEQLLVDPDCGLKTRTVQEAKDKLRAVQEGVNLVRVELGLN